MGLLSTSWKKKYGLLSKLKKKIDIIKYELLQLKNDIIPSATTADWWQKMGLNALPKRPFLATSRSLVQTTACRPKSKKREMIKTKIQYAWLALDQSFCYRHATQAQPRTFKNVIHKLKFQIPNIVLDLSSHKSWGDDNFSLTMITLNPNFQCQK